MANGNKWKCHYVLSIMGHFLPPHRTFFNSVIEKCNAVFPEICDRWLKVSENKSGGASQMYRIPQGGICGILYIGASHILNKVVCVNGHHRSAVTSFCLLNKPYEHCFTAHSISVVLAFFFFLLDWLEQFDRYPCIVTLFIVYNRTVCTPLH